MLGSKGQAVGGILDHYPTTPLIVGFLSLEAQPPAPVPLKQCWLAVCVAFLSESPSVVSIELISSGLGIETFVCTAFGPNQRLENQRSACRINV